MGRSMKVIAPFDPWNDPLCTCPPKYTLSPYTSCGHRCAYCYITSYIPGGFRPRPKRNFVKRLLSDLRRIKSDIVISMANSSDPYTPPEGRLGLTRRALEIMIPRGLRIQLMTKSSLVVRDLDLIRKGNVMVSFTITTLDRVKAFKLEPGAPEPEKRLKAMEVLSSSGVPCAIRIDPLLPGINTDENMVRALIKRAAEAGALHVISSTYKARPDSLRRIAFAFPDLKDAYLEAYRVEGEKVKRCVWYLKRRIREELLRMVRDLALEEGLSFAVCREGMPYLNTARTCDGTHLIPSRVKVMDLNTSTWKVVNRG